MKKIKLYGDLTSFKSDWELDVKTPSEALRAIEANRPGFLEATKKNEYAVILVGKTEKTTRRVLIDNAHDPWSDEVMVVVPVLSGEWGIGEAIWFAIAGAAAAAGATAGAAVIIADVVMLLISIGISLAVSAIANVITGDKKSVAAPDTEAYDSKPSFISNGAVNLVRAGNPYPILVGRVRDAGSIVLSSNYYVEDIPV